MKKSNLIILLFVFLKITSFINAQTCKEVIGYFPNWQWYDRAKLVNPSSINYAKYSIINYCFFKPETTGLISSTDSWADENLLKGQINWSTTPSSYYPNTSIVQNAHNAGTKVMVSIGGWTLSDNFPSIAASANKRAVFASECNRLLREYNFDGIDIDWEYPGFVEHSGTVNDKQNFTLLLQQIKDSITSQGLKLNKSYKLSACFGASASHASNINWNQVVPLLDMINLMTYDFFGGWDCKANHNSPLFAPGQGDPSFNLNAAFNLLTQTYAVPSTKINLGIGFYGRSQMGATSLYGTTNCTANSSLYVEDEGSPLYYNVMKNSNLFNEYWDQAAQVPYLLGKSGTTAAGTFVSFDNKKSVGKKAEYIMSNNARGAIIWELTGDYIETSVGSGVIGSTPLVDTLNYVFCNYSTNPPIAPSINSVTPSSRCGLGTVTLSATASSGVINWYANLSGGTSIGTGSSFTTPNISATTSYYVDATDNGITSSPRQLVMATVNSIPVVTLNLVADSICLNASPSQLNGGTPVGGTYTGTGVSNGMFNPQVSGLGSFTIGYSYSELGCSNSSNQQMIVSNCAINALGENDIVDRMKISPNPTNGLIYIEVNTLSSFEVQIFDMKGLIVYTKMIDHNANELNISELNAGVYVLKANINGKAFHSKLIKQ